MKNSIILLCAAAAISLFTASCKKTITVTKIVNDTLVISSKDTNFAMDVNSWNLYSHNTTSLVAPGPGTFFNTTEGIKFIAQGVRRGARLQTKFEVAFNDKTIYYKWKANGGGQFVEVAPQIKYDPTTSDANPPIQGVDFAYFSFINSVDGSYIIQTDVWYYTRVASTMGSDNYQVITSINNYDNKGGAIVKSSIMPVYTKHGYISIRLGDNYAGSNAYAVLGECKISSN